MTENNMNLLWVVNSNITNGIYPILYAYREVPYREEDSGWRLVSAGDNPKFLGNTSNVSCLTLEELVLIEPALARIEHLPVGSEVTLIQEESGEVSFINKLTSEPLTV